MREILILVLLSSLLLSCESSNENTDNNSNFQEKKYCFSIKKDVMAGLGKNETLKEIFYSKTNNSCISVVSRMGVGNISYEDISDELTGKKILTKEIPTSTYYFELSNERKDIYDKNHSFFRQKMIELKK